MVDSFVRMHSYDTQSVAVYKFGGVALAGATAIRHAVRLVSRRRRAPTTVVVSAMAGVTDDLLALARSVSRDSAEETEGQGRSTSEAGSPTTHQPQNPSH